MSPAFLGNYVTGRQLFSKVKVDRWLSLVLFPEKNECKKNEHFNLELKLAA
jgi:hypothetical protein